MIIGELFYPGKMDNLLQTKDLFKLPAFFDTLDKWDDDHLALRAKDGQLVFIDMYTCSEPHNLLEQEGTSLT